MNTKKWGQYFTFLVMIFALFIFSAGVSKCDRDDNDAVCVDRDSDGYCANSAHGPDCNDNDPNNWGSCQTCVDLDGDGYRGTGCDMPADCDDADPNNWQSCDACIDADGDDNFANCDSYISISGPDCDDADPNNWLSCLICTDADNDGHKGTGCDILQDCNDQEPNVWSNCGLDTFLLSWPTKPSNSAIASFTFNCNALDYAYQCSLDSGLWADCSSPQNYAGLSDGNHAFRVMAMDEQGNQDITPETYSWFIDTSPPDTFITGFPENPTRSQEAVFIFNCNESACVFECSLDGQDFAPCDSPANCPNLYHGPHTFEVRAIDGLGNIDPTPAAYNWNADLDGYWRTDTILHALPDGRSYHTAVWTGTEMIIWGGYNGSYLNTGSRYNPAIDTWTAMTTINAPLSRKEHAAVWTGTEMIVWGGLYVNAQSGQYVYLETGGRYNPATNSWISTSEINAPSPRFWHTAVWTGTEMIVWGGRNASYPRLNTGGRYDPGKDSWNNTTTSNAPAAMAGHVAVWTGQEMIVWGGGTYPFGRYNPESDSWTAASITDWPYGNESTTAVWTGNEMLVWNGSSGGRYNPSTDEWLTISSRNAPKRTLGFTAVWTGIEMIVWGGAPPLFSPRPPPPIGSRYNPLTDSWTATASANAPSERSYHTAVWTGTEMIIWGGGGDNTGGRYSPSTNSWTATTNYNMPAARHDYTTIWTDAKMIIWGGRAGRWSTGMIMISLKPLSGDIYDPATDSWTSISTINEPYLRTNHSAIWTGTEMIVWGGFTWLIFVERPHQPYENTGGRYNPATDSWAATSIVNTPSSRFDHTAVWTGTEMIIWGGYDGAELNTGGKYNPESDSWTAITTDSAPSARRYHTAVWTGSRMVVWGGGKYLNTGGRYDPSADSWSATSDSDAPSARNGHSAIWTGTEMIIWGGYNGAGINTGGRYDPVFDAWRSTTMFNAPSQMRDHTAVWTGTEMIIWGGGTNTGGKYNPLTDSWLPTSMIDVPSGRSLHSAVWTGAEMIIWGGGTNTGGRYVP